MENISEKIITNRIAIEKNLAKKYKITEEQCADLFQVPLRIIEKDFNENQIKVTGKRHFPMEKIKRSYYEEVQKLEKQGFGKEDALATYGLWTNALYFDEFTNGVDYGFGQDINNRIQYGLALKNTGYSMQDTKKIANLCAVESTIVNKNADSFGRNLKEEGQQFAEKLYKEGENPDTIKRVSGASMIKIIKGQDYYAITKEKIKNGIIVSPLKNSYREAHPDAKVLYSEEDKHNVYLRWRAKECTQQELANEYGVTRVTLGNWIREEKVKELGHLQENLPTVRQRNIQREKQEDRNRRKEETIALYQELRKEGMIHSDAVNKVAKELGHTYPYVLKFLREDGIAPTAYERKGEAYRQEGSIKLQEVYAMNSNVLFGYGPNAGKSGYIPGGGVAPDYPSHIHKQRETKYELDNHSRARQMANENRGDMMPYWDEKIALKHAKVLGNVESVKELPEYER